MSDDKFVPGEAVPWFHAKALDGNPRFAFHTVAGRPVMMLFVGSAAFSASSAALATVAANRDLFDDEQASLFGVSIDTSDVSEGRIAQQLPGIRWFLDDDSAISKAYHAVVAEDGKAGYRPHWLVLDRTLRMVCSYPIDRGEAAMAALRGIIASPDEPASAPVLVVPRIFEPSFCRTLIEAYDRDGGKESGFMRDVDGVTVEQFDHDHKRRLDYLVEDPRAATRDPCAAEAAARAGDPPRISVRGHARRTIAGRLLRQRRWRRAFPARTATTRPTAQRTAASPARST